LDWKRIKTHVDFSVKILAATKSVPSAVLRMVATHHERFDGTGYPEGIEKAVFGSPELYFDKITLDYFRIGLKSGEQITQPA